jgi:hypothetical protein
LLAGIAVGFQSHSGLAAETNHPPTGFLPLRSPASSGIADLVLIYQGGTHRLPWTSEQLSPYVSHRDPKSGHEAWLFDGFLFIEFMDGRGRQYADGYKKLPGRKEDWLWLLERNFEKGIALDALETSVAATTKRIGKPPHPRKVVLTLPEPIRGQKDWGQLDGRALDFDRDEDRVAACTWYVETAVKRWHAWAPAHLELAGFYWVAETAGSARALLPRIKPVIHAQGGKFFWIPYWNATGAKDWQQLGFDAAYQQPNHFFNGAVPDSRLDAACALARTNGLGLEFECDARAAKSADVFRPRLQAYLQAFDRHGVRTNAAVAYYEGGGALLQFANSPDRQVRALYDEIAHWIISRQMRNDG